MSNRRRPRPHRTSRESRSRHHSGAVDQDLEPWLTVMAQADREEARGNAEKALDLLCSLPDGPDGASFWRPWRIQSLAQLFVFQDVLPRWAMSRWVLAQALQGLDGSGRAVPGGRTLQAVEIAADLRGGLAGGDLQMAALTRVVDHDWVFRQVFLYELGGLEDFVRRCATRQLLDAADDLDAWAAAPMRGLRLLGRDAGTVTWEDLAGGSLVTVANNGSALGMVPTECAIGRLVPSDDVLVFEAAPLGVPERVARLVADDPPSWTSALRDRTVEEIDDGAHDFGVVHDVPTATWRSVVTPDLAALPLSTVLVETARAVLDRSWAALAGPIEDPADPSADVDVWPCLAAAMLDPTLSMVMPDALRPGDVAMLRRLADVVADPAAALLRYATDDPRAGGQRNGTNR